MSNIRTYALSGAGGIALVVAALVATGAVSYAQSSTPTDTPAATTAPPTDSTGGTAIPAPSDGATTPAPGDKSDGTHDPANCPNMGTDSSGTPGTSGSTSRYNMHGGRAPSNATTALFHPDA
ncbi:MAG: hypothetical protein ABI559_10555 [Chloroflexota bacterium]